MGFDADFCRALAAAALGDASAVEFVGLTSAERFAMLAAGEVDVLFRTTTWTQSRDTEIGSDFGPTTFYDGQQIMGKAGFGFTDASTLADVTVPVSAPMQEPPPRRTSPRVPAWSAPRSSWSPSKAPPRLWTCSARVPATLVTADGSRLFGERFAAVGNGEITEGEWIIFPHQRRSPRNRSGPSTARTTAVGRRRQLARIHTDNRRRERHHLREHRGDGR